MDEENRRADMGCAAMLFAPIFLIGAIAFAPENASRDSATAVNDVWSWILLIVAVVTFTVGSVVWVRDR